jgi:hypothetical protein
MFNCPTGIFNIKVLELPIILHPRFSLLFLSKCKHSSQRSVLKSYSVTAYAISDIFLHNYYS